MKPTHWIDVDGVRIPEFFCPVCGERLRLLNGEAFARFFKDMFFNKLNSSDYRGTDPPDTVGCTGCGFVDHVEG